MAKIFLFADPHFGHTNMALKRGFKSVEEHDEYIVSQWNKTVTKRDTVWVLGDMTMEKDNYSIFSILYGIKKGVLGNHDKPQHIQSLLKHFNLVCGMFKLDGYILTHCPIHESEINRFKGNIHGHVHENTINHPKYFNMSAEAIDYTPVQLTKITQNTIY